MRKNTKGFTLIELLIVVAIIAILAAIAIPNFLAAQIRSKVSRVKGEMATMATALESYYVDNNAYPNMVGDDGQPNMYGTPHVDNTVTTPIAYITNQPIDIFRVGKFANDPTKPLAMRYFYQNWDFYIRTAVGTVPNPYSYGLGIYGPWKLVSSGPATITMSWTIIYDPSNGVVSNGSIARTAKSASGDWNP